jgi:hypothetical protein
MLDSVKFDGAGRAMEAHDEARQAGGGLGGSPLASLATFLLASLLGGCASIVSGTTQVVSVDTPGCPGASCEMSNDKGKWYVSQTPGTVSISRAYGPLLVSCKLNDTTGNAAFNSSTKGMAFGNILFGGVIGAGIDMGSGAAYDYPPSLSVPMTCAPTAIHRSAQTAVPETVRSPIKLGIRGESVTEAVALAAGAQVRNGVFITAVDEGGIAHSMGLKRGQILLEFNGMAVANLEALAQMLTATEQSAAVEFVVFEGGRQFRVTRPRGAL